MLCKMHAALLEISPDVGDTPEVRICLAQIETFAPDKHKALQALLDVLARSLRALNLAEPADRRLWHEILDTLYTITLAAPREVPRLTYQALFVTRTEAKNWRKLLFAKRDFCLTQPIGHNPRFYALVKDAVWKYADEKRNGLGDSWENLQVRLNTPGLALQLRRP